MSLHSITSGCNNVCCDVDKFLCANSIIFSIFVLFCFYFCSFLSVDKQMAENLAQDMADLMHDFDVVSR